MYNFIAFCESFLLDFESENDGNEWQEASGWHRERLKYAE